MLNERLCKKLLEVILGIEIFRIEYPEEQKTIDMTIDASKSFVIFICLSDIFKRNRHIYTFKNLCIEDTELELHDEAIKVFLNPYSDRDDVDKELKNFLLYIAGGQPADVFTGELDDEVKKVKKNRKWRREYMTLMMRDQENIKKGIELGRSEGIREGMKEGIKETVINMLKKGLDIHLISELSGFTYEEIEKLREEHMSVNH